MKPIKTTIEGEQEAQRRNVCDEVIGRATKIMVEEVGASIEMMLDRLFTYAAAQSFHTQGKANTVRAMREMAKNIEDGALDDLHLNTGEVKH